MKIFISGSMSSTKIPVVIQSYIQNHIDEEFLVGDCFGIDSEIQKFLKENNALNITIYHSSLRPRNNVGYISKYINPGNLTGRALHTCKDNAMIQNCDMGIAIWDGKSKGTWRNIEELSKLNKRVIVYNLIKNEMEILR